jgi:hypothetical protein
MSENDKMTKKKRKVSVTRPNDNTDNETAKTDIESRDLDE